MLESITIRPSLRRLCISNAVIALVLGCIFSAVVVAADRASALLFLIPAVLLGCIVWAAAAGLIMRGMLTVTLDREGLRADPLGRCLPWVEVKSCSRSSIGFHVASAGFWSNRTVTMPSLALACDPDEYAAGIRDFAPEGNPVRARLLGDNPDHQAS